MATTLAYWTRHDQAQPNRSMNPVNQPTTTSFRDTHQLIVSTEITS